MITISEAQSIKRFVQNISYIPTLETVRISAGIGRKTRDKWIKEYCEIEGIELA